MDTTHPVTSDHRGRSGQFGWRVSLVLFAAYMALTCAIQIWIGALPGAFGAHPDEGAHYVTGLMIRDYLLSGDHGSPMAYALRYYAHYPAVALGHWPPGFYVVEALWVMLFGPSRVGLLILEQAFAAVSATLVTRLARERLGWGLSIFAGSLFLIIPITRSAIGLTAPEMLMCALVLIAALVYAAYLDAPSVRLGALFGLLAAAAILVKSNAFLLGLLPAFMLLLTRRWGLLKTAGFWMPLIVVGVIVGPWQILTLGQAPPMLGDGGIVGAVVDGVPTLVKQMIYVFGKIVVPVAVICAILAVRQWRTYSTQWRVVMVVAFATVVFHVLIGAGLELRYMITAVPAGVLLIAATIDALRERLATTRPMAARVAAVAACGLVFVGSIVPPRGWSRRTHYNPAGINLAADAVMREVGSQPAAILVSSQDYKEVAFVAEIAMREPRRPHHYVVRGHKAFATTDWFGKNLEQTTRNEAQMVAYLDSVPIRYVVIDTAKGLWPVAHHAMLRHVVETRPEWQRQSLGNGSTRLTFELFRRTGDVVAREPQVNVSVAGMRAGGRGASALEP